VSLASSTLQRVLVITGGGALLAAMGIDALAVLGRHVGIPLLGSIELVQAAVLVSGSIALLIATLAGVHARVHLLVDRLPAAAAEALRRLGLLLGAVLYLALLVGSLWIARDLWQGHEESELLALPYRPLRAFAALATGSVALAFLAQTLRRPGR
jgi:TRAP-type C4-dicarboxylate transport system permease small subunit